MASVSDLIMDRVSPGDGRHVVITMRRYPRFINRRLRDEYLSCMSPEKELFEDWLSAKRAMNDHNGAFAKSKFEERFEIAPAGLREMRRLVELSKERDVYFVCNCAMGTRCHRDLLMILAARVFGAEADRPPHAYPVFAKRMAEFRVKAREALREGGGEGGPDLVKPSRKKTRVTAGGKNGTGRKRLSVSDGK